MARGTETGSDIPEDEVRQALERLDPLWDELFPAEQARIVQLLVERVDIGPDGADIRLRTEGLTNLLRDLGAVRPRAQRAAGDGRTIVVRVPLSIRKRGGRKLVLAPDGSNVTTAPAHRHIDSAMVKAIARAFRWREMLENGTHATIAEIASAEEINESYVGRVLRLTLLAPDIIDAILSGRQPPELTLASLMQPFPVAWMSRERKNSVRKLATEHL